MDKYTVKFRKKAPPCRNPSKYKPPKPITQKPSAKTVNFLPTIRLAQSILKRKFPSVDKPLPKLAPQKGPLKTISPGAYFRNFTVV